MAPTDDPPTPEAATEVAPRPDTAPAAPPDPPGLDAIRRFFRRPWIQGIWAWLCLFGRGIRAAWKWLDKNAGPIARGIEKAGNTAVGVSRGAVKVGHAAGEIGGKLSEWGRARRDAGGERLRRMGEGIRGFGRRATRVGTQAEDVAESVEDLGEELVSLTGGEDGKGRGALAPPPESPKPRPSSSRRLKPPRRTTPAPKPRATEPPKPAPETAASAEAESDGELPEVFRERIRALGKRRRSKPLRQLILDICAVREWTTVGELSEWLGTDASNLRKRHLGPMVKSGRLRLQYPENRSHPEQAYRATGV